jgi:YggT family protein
MLADAAQDVLCPLLTVFMVLLFARAILSWFPVQHGSFLQQVNDVLRVLTDWAVLPLRRIIPPAGMFDLSFLVLFVGVMILRSAICN